MKITVKQAAKLLEIDTASLRCGIKAGRVPFGTCWRNEGSTTDTYLIYNGKLAETLGVSVEELQRRLTND